MTESGSVRRNRELKEGKERNNAPLNLFSRLVSQLGSYVVGSLDS